MVKTQRLCPKCKGKTYVVGNLDCPECEGLGYISEEFKLYKTQFPYFFKAMINEMERHYPEKGDSYHESDVEWLEELLYETVEKYKKLENDYPRKESQAVDIANVCAMLYMRLMGV